MAEDARSAADDAAVAKQTADTAAADPPASTTTYTPPPPEKPADAQRRSLIVLWFWFIVLLGVPIWWKTTTIYRARLPLDRMFQWADGKACKPLFPLQISVRADSLSEQEAQHLVRLTQHALDDLNDFTAHHLRLQLTSSAEGVDDSAHLSEREGDVFALTISLNPGNTSSASLSSRSTTLDVSYAASSIPSLNSASSPLASLIAKQLRNTFAEEQSAIAYLLSSSPVPLDVQHPTLSPETVASLSKQSIKTLRYAPVYHITFSLFTGDATPNSWDIEAAVDDYVRPVLDLLRPLHNFTIDTQVQLYATPGVQSEELDPEHLASFINAAEWPLSPSIGGAPTINFLIYVGNQTIVVDPARGKTARSWTIPQWGSVYLLSLPQTDRHVPKELLKQPMLTFAGHLLQLLGLPPSGPMPLRLSSLARIRSLDLLLRASSSLGSLARLSLALPSISIPRSVADGVTSSLHHLERACANLSGPEGLCHARIAEEEAERAFFEKSMVGQLYFPDEHKVAVYLPLLGPIGVPLVLGLIAEIRKRLKKRTNVAKQAADEDEKEKARVKKQ